MKHTCLALLPLLGFTTDAWQSFAIDKYVSMQLPVLPTELKEEIGLPASTHVFIARTGNSIYQLIGPIPIEATIKVQAAKTRRDYYDGVVDGLVKDQGNTLISRAAFPTAAGEGVAVSYQAPATETSKAMVLFSCSFIANHSSYALTFFQTEGDTTGSAVQRRRFFHSITVKP